MADRQDQLVLRSFHLPKTLDDALRGAAFTLRCSKADLIRSFAIRGMRDLERRHGDSWDPAAVGRIRQEIEAGMAPEVAQGLEADLGRFVAESPESEEASPYSLEPLRELARG